MTLLTSYYDKMYSYKLDMRKDFIVHKGEIESCRDYINAISRIIIHFLKNSTGVSPIFSEPIFSINFKAIRLFLISHLRLL